MDRREFLAAGVLGAMGTGQAPGRTRAGPEPGAGLRSAFARLAGDTYVNAAALTPLGAFAEEGMRRYLDYQRLGPGEGRREYVLEAQDGARRLFAELIGARPAEIALVHCTKAGEQIVLDGLDPRATGRNVVTNDMHFSGSLHNLVGLERAGADVRIVRSRDWEVSVEAMAEAMDDDTALVSVTLVSNVTGRIEPVRELAEIAHAHGAFLYADIIQAAGIVPVDVRALGIDFAAANGYKWLYGTYGAGFLFVREELQGRGLPDRLFPGYVEYNYPPWVDQPDHELGPYRYREPEDARRYEPGHVGYAGYCAVYEGLRFIERVGVERALAHSLELNARLESRLDSSRYERITPAGERTPILSFTVPDADRLRERLRAAGVTVTVGPNYVRVSPALYNDEGDMDRLAAALDQGA